MDQQINPCDFCYKHTNCRFEDQTTRSCSMHLCILPDEHCGYNNEQKADCVGYGECPNVQAFYKKKETN